MKDISIYLTPNNSQKEFKEGNVGSLVEVYDETGFPIIENNGIAIVSVPEYRNSSYSEAFQSDELKEKLFNLKIGDGWSKSIYDLGTVNPGKEVKDTYFALSQIVAELVKKDVIPIIIGGSQDLTLACYKGFETLERTINICSIDSKLDIGDPATGVNYEGFISHLLMQRPCYLFNYSVIGLQRPYVTKDHVELFDKLYFDYIRLGQFQDNFKVAEPHLRNSDLLSVDVQSIKNEAIGSGYSHPNGFRSDQICQVAKYAGLSDKMSCVGLFNLVGENTNNQLLAEFVWYFIDGVNERVGDFPIGSKMGYQKFHAHLEDFEDDLVFYRSNRSERWWLEVRYPGSEKNKYERHHMVPCDRDDYDAAMKNIIPDLWWKTLQKLS